MHKPLNLTFAAHITGANEATRQISGIVVPFGKSGNTSAGPVIFEVGSIDNPDPKPVKFLLQHDAQRPIGKAIEFQVTPGGITGTFKVSNTTAGSDALVEAADGLRDGLSVGAQIDSYTIKDGVMRVTAAKIVEVSLVHAPAFPMLWLQMWLHPKRRQTQTQSKRRNKCQNNQSKHQRLRLKPPLHQ